MMRDQIDCEEFCRRGKLRQSGEAHAAMPDFQLLQLYRLGELRRYVPLDQLPGRADYIQFLKVNGTVVQSGRLLEHGKLRLKAGPCRSLRRERTG
jgi:hypothetical protein